MHECKMKGRFSNASELLVNKTKQETKQAKVSMSRACQKLSKRNSFPGWVGKVSLFCGVILLLLLDYDHT